MSLGKRKWLFCPKCDCQTWATLVARFNFACETCGTEIDLMAAKKKASNDRKSARVEKSKAMGTYKSKASEKLRKRIDRRGEPDVAYMKWITSLPCCVCSTSVDIHAHHAVLKSQMGPDKTCVPLCCEHHTQYHKELGSITAAEKDWQVNLLVVVDRLNSEYDQLLHSALFKQIP